MRGFGGGVSQNCSGEERTVLNNYQHPHSLILFINYFSGSLKDLGSETLDMTGLFLKFKRFVLFIRYLASS